MDFDFRPASYWDLSDPATVLISAIAGHHRRDIARRTLKQDRAAVDDAPGYFIEELFAEQLTPGRRESFKAVSEVLTFGEYLPALTEGSVEIARLIFAHEREANVVSVRAFRGNDGFIHYSAVDEHDTAFTFQAPRQKQPLTLDEISTLVETIRPTDPEIIAAWNERADEMAAIRLTIESEFYPGLHSLFGNHVLPFDSESDEESSETEPPEPAVDTTDLVYGETDTSLVFIPREIAHHLAQTWDAVNVAKTWGEFRALAPRSAYDKQFRLAEGWDHEKDAPLTDSSAFQAIGVEDGDYPAWPQQLMLDWLPVEIQNRDYAHHCCSIFNGGYLDIDTDSARRVVRDLKRLGYRCRRSQKLVLRACGMGDVPARAGDDND